MILSKVWARDLLQAFDRSTLLIPIGLMPEDFGLYLMKYSLRIKVLSEANDFFSYSLFMNWVPI